MTATAYQVRPIGRLGSWSVELQGFWGREALKSEPDARILAGHLARANRPSEVILHGAGDEVRGRRTYAEPQPRFDEARQTSRA